jgi:hypothetical protein
MALPPSRYWLQRFSLFRAFLAVLLISSSIYLGMTWLPGFFQWMGLMLPPFTSANRLWAPMPPRVILSMATVGGRVDNLKHSLPLLLNQSHDILMILISVNKAEPKAVLHSLTTLGFGPFVPGFREGLPYTFSNETGRSIFSGQDGIVLQFLDKDWGPGTKLVGAFLVTGSDPNTVIITVDDDCK